MQDLGAAGLTCALAELTARGGVGAEVDLDAVPRREGGMTPYEVLLSESQERMLLVVEPRALPSSARCATATSLHSAEIGMLVDEPIVRCRAGGELVCAVPGRALADDAPRYALFGTPAAIASRPTSTASRPRHRRPRLCSSCSGRRTCETASRSGAATTT